MAPQSAMPADPVIPAKREAVRAWCRPSTARMSVLDGTQPTLTQVPPMVPWPISATLAPSSAAVIAAENPAEPAPITATSYPSRPTRRSQQSRSEEHTSELQSLMRISYAVFCLKKTQQHTHILITHDDISIT